MQSQECYFAFVEINLIIFSQNDIYCRSICYNTNVGLPLRPLTNKGAFYNGKNTETMDTV